VKLPALIGRAPEAYDDVFMDTMAGEYFRRTPWTQLRLAVVEEFVEPKPGDRILDLGCAAGAITDFLSGFGTEVVGVDSEARAIEHARSLFPKLRFEQADVASLPFGTGSLDKAVAADLIEHLPDETFRAMLRECRRVLVPGGTLTLYTPNPKHVIERLKEHNIVLARNETHIGLRSSEQIGAALAEAGYEVDRNEWRRSFFRGLRGVERLAGPHLDLFRYRLCIRGRTPAA
jgi:SAM-dependent methyltransferase